MIETVLALLLAHAVADFVLQNRWIVQNKGRAGALLLHGALVLLTAQVATGQWAAPALLVLAAVHVLIDLAKARLTRGGIGPFLADQAAHMATIGAVAVFAPDLWATGLWPGLIAPDQLDLVLHGILVVITLIFALRGGEFAVGLLMRRYAARMGNSGLPQAGRTIGWLERGLVCLFIGTGIPAGIGFLVAAKSILRFGTASKDQKHSEYVIIGTLASFGWALTIALIADWTGANLLPPLEIGPARP
ncbi:DUF3307 domain-containing protein [Marivivens marinus]|uniref:DUF3307 domain-containing protein n=1 Tax=Marivivens marinus TaxID=3110173 RepID=UPI003B849397